jgi:hypothetical protein
MCRGREEGLRRDPGSAGRLRPPATGRAVSWRHARPESDRIPRRAGPIADDGILDRAPPDGPPDLTGAGRAESASRRCPPVRRQPVPSPPAHVEEGFPASAWWLDAVAASTGPDARSSLRAGADGGTRPAGGTRS